MEEMAYSLRGRLSESIEDIIPYSQSSLGQGLLLGLRGDLPPDMSRISAARRPRICWRSPVCMSVSWW